MGRTDHRWRNAAVKVMGAGCSRKPGNRIWNVVWRQTVSHWLHSAERYGIFFSAQTDYLIFWHVPVLTELNIPSKNLCNCLDVFFLSLFRGCYVIYSDGRMQRFTCGARRFAKRWSRDRGKGASGSLAGTTLGFPRLFIVVVQTTCLRRFFLFSFLVFLSSYSRGPTTFFALVCRFARYIFAQVPEYLTLQRRSRRRTLRNVVCIEKLISAPKIQHGFEQRSNIMGVHSCGWNSNRSSKKMKVQRWKTTVRFQRKI